jgi:hypothetical protein
MPSLSKRSIASLKRSPNSAEAKAATEVAGSDPSSSEASPEGGLSPLTLVLRSISIWPDPGTRLATAVA